MRKKIPRRTIGVRALKNELSEVISEIAEKREEYAVTLRGRPIAVIRPWREEDQLKERATRNAEIIERIQQTADRVGAKAGRKSAVAAVSAQRR